MISLADDPMAGVDPYETPANSLFRA